MTSQSKQLYWNKKADALEAAIDQLHYGELDRAQMLLLREIINIIHPVPYTNRNWRKDGFRLGSHQEYMYERLEDAYRKGEVPEMINKVLHAYEKYELLAVLVKRI